MAGTLHVSLRSLLIGSTVILTLMLAAPAANAEALGQGHVAALGAGCPGVIEHPFAPWGDDANYVLAPDGDLTGGGAGWELNGAGLVVDNEPWYVHGGDTPAAVHFDDGDSATTPPICITRDYPTMRFFVRSSGEPVGGLTVEAILPSDVTFPIGTISSAGVGDEWAPSPVLRIFANLVAGEVRFRFTANGTGSSWVIDDVYVDPYGKG